METFLGIMIPFLGTTLGSTCVFFMKKSLGDLVQRSLAGFAAGVMVAASIWSLLIPAIEQSEGMGKLSFLPAFIGFWVGVLSVSYTHLLCTAHVDSVNVLHDSDHEFCVLLLYSTMSTEVKCISLDIC